MPDVAKIQRNAGPRIRRAAPWSRRPDTRGRYRALRPAPSGGVPLGWVASVDEAVHLAKVSCDVRKRASAAQGIG